MNRQKIAFQGSQTTLSSTTSVLVSVKVTAAGAQRVVVTGVSFNYDTAFTTVVNPKITESVTGGPVLWTLPNCLSSTFVAFTYPIVGSPGTAVIASTTCSAAAQTCAVSLLYYMDR